MSCLHSRLNIAEERISKLEDRSKQINQKSGHEVNLYRVRQHGSAWVSRFPERHNWEHGRGDICRCNIMT